MKSVLDTSRRKKRRYGSWARGEIRRKKRFVDKDSPGKKEVKNDHEEVKTTEEEVDEADSFKMAEDEEKSEVDVSGQSFCKSAEGDKVLKEASEAEKKNVQVSVYIIIFLGTMQILMNYLGRCWGGIMLRGTFNKVRLKYNKIA